MTHALKRPISLSLACALLAGGPALEGAVAFAQLRAAVPSAPLAAPLALPAAAPAPAPAALALPALRPAQSLRGLQGLRTAQGLLRKDAGAAPRALGGLFDRARRPLNAEDGWEKAPLRLEPLADRLEALPPARVAQARAAAALVGEGLFTWSAAPLRLPGTVFKEGDDAIVPVDRLLKRPTSDEVARLAIPQRPFSAEQLAEIRRQGTFQVASRDFPGQNHEWRLGRALQKGTAPTLETLRDHAAAGLDHVLIGMPDRVLGERPLSLRRGGRSLKDGLKESLSLVLGFPELSPKHADHEIETRVDETLRQHVLARGGEIGIELPLYDAKLSEKAAPVLEDIERRAGHDWAAKEDSVRESLERDLRGRGLDGEELLFELEKSLEGSRRSELERRILADKPLAKLHPGLPKAVADRMEALRLLLVLQADFDVETGRLRQAAEEELIAARPVLSRVGAWRERKVQAALDRSAAARRDAFLRSASGALSLAGLETEAWLAGIEGSFLASSAPRLRAALAAERAPSGRFDWKRRLWRASRWTIERHGEGTADSPFRYSANKHRTTTVSSGLPLWRWANVFVRWGTWTNNGTYHLLVSNLWNGALGLKSLVLKEPFPFGVEVDYATGRLVPSPSRVGTLVSRVKALRASRREILADHEKKNDYGIFGKGIERLGLFFTADLARGVIAPLLVIVGQPLLTAANLAVSAVLAATSLAWAGAASLGLWAFNAVVADTEGTRYGRRWHSRLLPLVRRLVFQAGLGGLGESALSVLALAVFHPALALFQFAWGGLRTGVRSAYDAALFRVIRRFGRIPGRDTRFFVKRTAGPGLSSEYFYQVSPELAVTALWASMERERLARFETSTAGRLEEPRKLFDEAVRTLSAVAGEVHVSALSSAYEQIRASGKGHAESLREALGPRQELYGRLLDVREARRIKLASAELELTLKKGALLAKRFYEDGLEKEGEAARAAFWKAKGLAAGDWVGLAKQHLAAVFGAEFLTGLEETDKTMRLKVETPGLADYAKGLEDGLLPEDLAEVDVDLGRPAGPGTLRPSEPRVRPIETLSGRLLAELPSVQ